jgi:hypothetical protein
MTGLRRTSGRFTGSRSSATGRSAGVACNRGGLIAQQGNSEHRNTHRDA